jgi:hypothetical protein
VRRFLAIEREANVCQCRSRAQLLRGDGYSESVRPRLERGRPDVFVA